MEAWQKFIDLLDKKQKERALMTALKIMNWDLKGLDIKKMQGTEDEYRCRIGKIRIRFLKLEQGAKILRIGFRGDVYDR